MIRLALVEDNIAGLQALKQKLSEFPDIIIRHEACNGQEMLNQLSADASIDLVLMDIEMPVLNGIEAAAVLKQKYPHIKVVIITIYDDDEFIFNAIKAGADSYILKETKAEKIYETIQDTLRDGAVMSPSIAVKAIKALKYSTAIQNPINAPELTSREAGVLELLSKGLTNKIIAERLAISPFTVKRHIENIYKKLQAQNRIELLDKARQSKLL